MNKKLEEFYQAHQMTVNKNHGYGVVEGYEVNINLSTMVAPPLTMHISCYIPQENKNQVINDLQDAKIKFLKHGLTEYGLYIGLSDMTNGRLFGRMEEVLLQVLGILKNNGALGSEYCPICGEAMDPVEAKKCNIDGFTITLDNHCVENINTVIEQENTDFDNAPNNYIMGFLGACVGGFVGAVLAFILNFVGFISSVSALVAAALGSILYVRFGGKQNKMMIVIVVITTIAFMLLSVFIVYLVAAGIAAHNEGLDMSAMTAFRICMYDDEYKRLFITDICLTLLFSCLGVSYQAYKLFKTTGRAKQI
ncbi:MAG: hypothetical protein K2H02_01955 [Anaeroplasmataceae bacterium]|nr:hypothetical protein [Anaeroplasmataceae bacterium]